MYDQLHDALHDRLHQQHLQARTIQGRLRVLVPVSGALQDFFVREARAIVTLGATVTFFESANAFQKPQL